MHLLALCQHTHPTVCNMTGRSTRQQITRNVLSVPSQMDANLCLCLAEATLPVSFSSFWLWGFTGDAEAWKLVMMHRTVLSGAILTSAAVLPSLPTAEPVIPGCWDALDKPMQ